MITKYFTQLDITTFFQTYQSIIGVLITGGIAIWLFLLGIKKERRLHQEKLDKEYNINLERKRAYLKAMLKGIIKDIEKQIEHYKFWCKEVETNPYQIDAPKQRPHYFLKIFLDSEGSSLFDVFKFRNIDIESFHVTLYDLAFTYDFTIRTYDDFVHGNGRARINAANNFTDIIVQILDGDKSILMEKESKFIIAQLTQITEFNNPEIREIEKDYYNIIKPIIDYYNENQVSAQFLKQYCLHALKAGDYRETIKGLNNYLKDDLEPYIPIMEQKITTLKKISNSL